jgi:hypothetical protein
MGKVSNPIFKGCRNYGRLLYIDLLTYLTGKAYGFNEYIDNLLTYISLNHRDLKFDKIVLIVNSVESQKFKEKYPQFEVQSFKFDNIYKRIYYQLFWNIHFKFNHSDVLLYVSNYSSLSFHKNQVLVIHDLLYLRPNWFPYKLLRLQRLLMVPLSIYKATRIIAISNYTLNDIVRNFTFSKSKIQVVHNYFNFGKYNDDNILNRENNIISVASNAIHKNTLLVLKAFEKYRSLQGIYDLILVGKLVPDSPSEKYYSNLSASVKSHITIYSDISSAELSKLYSTSKIYISASRFEGFGMPIVEAMYFNLHLVLPSYPEVFKEISCDSANYFQQDNEISIADILLELEKKSVQPQLRKLAIEKYSELYTAAKYVKILNNINGPACFET